MNKKLKEIIERFKNNPQEVLNCEHQTKYLISSLIHEINEKENQTMTVPSNWEQGESGIEPKDDKVAENYFKRYYHYKLKK